MMYSLKNRRRFFPIIILAAIAGFGLLTMLLWNVVIPHVFRLPEINYLQAVSLLVLTRLLFGGTPFKHHSHPSFIHEKLSKMSPEEQEEFKNRWSKIRQSHWRYDHQPENEKAKSETDSN